VSDTDLEFVDAALLWVDRTVDNLAVVVRAVGEVDLATAPLLSAQLELAEAVVVPPAPVILDLTGVTFFESAGVNVLLNHHGRCADRGTRLEVIGSRAVIRVITLAGVDQALQVVPPTTTA
jgi:anti-sigma B factor antagonist